MRTLPGLDVSRETLEKLAIYQALVEKWTQKINLVSRTTIDDLWQRHFVDSAQLLKLCPSTVEHWADLGSGAGFPGLVVAILAEDLGFPRQVSLVESDTRKAVFLRTVLRETDVQATVLDSRIEQLTPLNADVLSARALADLTTLLDYTAHHLSDEGIALFLKGQNWRSELEAAQTKWRFKYNVDKSVTSPSSVILRIEGPSLV